MRYWPHVAIFAERFAYYSMLAILLFFLIHPAGHGLARTEATAVISALKAGIIVLPLFGGIVVDRLLGFRSASIAGAGLFAAGYAMLAVAPLPPLVALSVIALAHGIFRPAIYASTPASWSGSLDAAFLLVVVAVNAAAYVGAYAAGAAIQLVPLRIAVAIPALATLIALVAAFRLPRHAEPALRPTAPDGLPRAVLILGAVVILQLVVGLATGSSEYPIAALLALPLVVALAIWLQMRATLGARFTERLIFVGVALLIAGLALRPLTGTAAAVASAVGTAMLTGVAYSLIVQRVAPNRRGTWIGGWQTITAAAAAATGIR
jgi:proton-dependent oligopeptide transporter, POT family